MEKTASLPAAMAKGRAHTTPSYPCHPSFPYTLQVTAFLLLH